MRLYAQSLLAFLAILQQTAALDLDPAALEERQLAVAGLTLNLGVGTGTSVNPPGSTAGSQGPTKGGSGGTPTVTTPTSPPTDTKQTDEPPASTSAPPNNGGSDSTDSTTEKPTSRTGGTTATRTSPSLTTHTSALVSSSTQVFVTTIFTVSDGVTLSSIATSSRVIETTTGFATYTSTPGLNGDNNGSGSGLSDGSKKIIGGVVGGIGGLILLGGIGVVLWRIYGKKRRNTDDDYDDYMSGGTDSIKQSSVNKPFQSTLDSYHVPGQKPNTAANF